MIGTSDATLSLKKLIESVAHSDATVLIIGESGTGKELVAKSLHDCSLRAEKNLVPVNCGAIPRELIESELFGHKRGSFTGAVADRLGRFEMANGGTLFLDEIGDLTLDMQVKLLRAIQERVVEPVGGGKAVKVDVRVVAATHKDLEKEVEQGRFREDLYYRLNVLPLSTPPLRDRVEDIPQLIGHFARVHASKGRSPIRLSEPFMAALTDYNWPGNIRELSNLIARFSALFPEQTICYADVPQEMLPRGLRGRVVASGKKSASKVKATEGGLASNGGAGAPTRPVGASQLDLIGDTPTAASDHAPNADGQDALDALLGGGLPEPAETDQPIQVIGQGSGAQPIIAPGDYNPIEDLISLAQGAPLTIMDGVPLKKRLTDIEKALIEQALEQADGNVSKTARILSVQRTTLIEKINKYELKFKPEADA
jgi:sigma-54 specific flagellar transcriptional regulator A